MKLREVMRTDVLTAPSDQSADEAWARMRASKADYLVVISQGGVVGVLSWHDLSGPLGGGRRRMGRVVANLMHRDVVTATPETTVARAAAKMRKWRVGCLPVLARGRLVGIVTTYEMLGLLADARQQADARTQRPRKENNHGYQRSP